MSDEHRECLEMAEEARRLVLDLFAQECLLGDKYDHFFMSTYEHAQDKLIEWGLITKDMCKRL